jgi:hypothetical protein
MDNIQKEHQDRQVFLKTQIDNLQSESKISLEDNQTKLTHYLNTTQVVF